MEEGPERIIDGQVVLDDDAKRGTKATSVRVSDEELALIRGGQRQAEEGRLVDARRFLAVLRAS